MPEVLLGEYVVERPLGVGGMGHVVLARSRSTGRPYAVKRALPHNPQARSRLLRELQTWIDLPPFPHLVTCHFFRTLGDEIAIFAEYVEGGSLTDGLAQGRWSTLPEILDVAIQLAWGLHAAHRLGVVHQDVKPSNALVTSDGIIKVADFGLAREGDGQGARFGGALTRGYCSPEQAEMLAQGGADIRQITPASDQWSWGVTVLELFTGQPPCRYGGQLAPSVLASFLAQGGQECDRPALPPLVAEVLRKCFARLPADRWPSLEAAADVLSVAYTLATGIAYPRSKPAWPSRRAASIPIGENAPADWVQRVSKAIGEVIDLPDSVVYATSRRARAVADLALFAEAQKRLTAHCQSGRTDQEPLLAELCLAHAAAHREAGDLPGALRLSEQAIELLCPRVNAGEAEWASLLLEALHQAETCRRETGQYAEAVALAGQVIDRCAESHRTEHLRARRHRAESYFLMEDYPAALADLEQARKLTDALHLPQQRAEIDLLTARVAQANGEPHLATAWLNEAVPRLEQQAKSGQATPRDLLATAYLARARLLAEQPSLEAAQGDAARAWAIWQERATDRDRLDVAEHLAEVLVLQGGLALRQNQAEAALAYLELAERTLDRLVGSLGRVELLPDLAQVLLQKADALARLGQTQETLAHGERGLNLLEAQVVGGRTDLTSDLAAAFETQAHRVGRTGLDPRPLLHTACVLYRGLVQDRGRWDLLPRLLQAERAAAHAAIRALDPGAARERLEQVCPLAEAVVESRESADLLTALAEVYLDRARLAIALGSIPEAQTILCNLMIRLERQPAAEALRQRTIQLLTTLW